MRMAAKPKRAALTSTSLGYSVVCVFVCHVASLMAIVSYLCVTSLTKQLTKTVWHWDLHC